MLLSKCAVCHNKKSKSIKEKNPKYDENQRGHASLVYKSFDKKVHFAYR